MSTTARLFIDPLPELGEGAGCYQLDCRWGTTTMLSIPGPINLPASQIVTSLLYRHEAECGHRNTARLWREHADPALRAEAERTWKQLGATARWERRN